MDDQIEIGSIVSIPTKILFEELSDMIDSLVYKVRPIICGVVTDINGKNKTYAINWAINGLFDMSVDIINNKNMNAYEKVSLSLVLTKEYANIGGDQYLNTFFEHNNLKNGWELKSRQIICRYCHDLPTGFAGCQRENIAIQEPMTHLYLDLLNTINEDIDVDKKRVYCTKWYMRIKYGVPTDGYRRKICPCIGIEINRHFPIEENKVGYKKRSAD